MELLFLRELSSLFQYTQSTIALHIGKILTCLILIGIFYGLWYKLIIVCVALIITQMSYYYNYCAKKAEVLSCLPDQCLLPHKSHRFKAKEREMRPQHCFLPFGLGPRTCIAMRFVQLVAKITIIELLKQYSFTYSSDTEVTPKLA